MKLLFGEKKRQELIIASCVVFLLITHSYRWMNSMYNHDSLLIIQGDREWQISLGRIFNPLYVWLRGEIAAPGNVALLSSLFLIIAVLLCMKILRVQKTVSLILCCGFLTTFETLAFVNASFLLSLDLDMLALMFAVLGAYFLTSERNILRYLLGILSVTASLGLFQSYIEVTIILVCLAMMRDLLEGKAPKSVFLNGIRSAVLVFVSGLLYYLCLKIVWKTTGVMPADTANGLVKMKKLTPSSIVSLTWNAWRYTFYYLFHDPLIAHKTISIWLYRGLGMFSLLGISVIAKRKQIGGQALLLLVVLLLFMPLGGDAVFILSLGYKHSLMTYSFVFYSIFAVMIFDLLDFDSEIFKKARWVVPILCSVLLLNHVLFANQLYIRKDLQSQAGMSFMTRLVSRMETTENYQAGETPVLILGRMEENPANRENEHYSVTDDVGVGTRVLVVSYYGTYFNFFNYLMSYPVNLVPLSEVENYLHIPAIQEMPIYPAEGSVKMINDVLVVRLSENLLPWELR